MIKNIQIVEDVHILELLQETPYPPEVLYRRGEIRSGPEGPTPLAHKFITIVGSRICSEYGKQVVDEICKSLESQPVSIISGLANGIDIHAHKCALKYNIHTIAVLGCGLGEKVLQTHSNYRVAQKILDAGGALISEYESSQTSRSYMFPARNRIMVGISDLIIIIEAKEKSGTSITARLATDYNRDLMVVPNSIHSSYSKGSNELIKQGAYVYTKPEDIFNLLNLNFKENKFSTYTPTDTEHIIIQAINSGHNKTQLIIDECSNTCTTSEIIQMLLNLEIEDVIKRVDGIYIVL